MRHLSDVWGEVKKEIDDANKVLLCLDYDGTITPIVERPGLAVLSKETRNLLNRISKKSKYVLCVISGRSLSVVKKLVGVKGIYYVGNHGLEADGHRLRYTHPAAIKTRPVIRELQKELKEELKHIDGAILEYKDDISVAIHYRIVRQGDVPKVRDVFYATVKPYTEKKLVRTTENKKTLEVLPNVKWTKGEMLRKMMERQKPGILPVYAGDAKTDEDAFKTLDNRGVTILVSERKRKSHARYYVKNVSELIGFLKALEENR